VRRLTIFALRRASLRTREKHYVPCLKSRRTGSTILVIGPGRVQSKVNRRQSRSETRYSLTSDRVCDFRSPKTRHTLEQTVVPLRGWNLAWNPHFPAPRPHFFCHLQLLPISSGVSRPCLEAPNPDTSQRGGVHPCLRSGAVECPPFRQYSAAKAGTRSSTLGISFHQGVRGGRFGRDSAIPSLVRHRVFRRI